MESRSHMKRSKVFQYVVPACAALVLLGGCSQSRVTMSRHDSSTATAAIADIDSALGASDSLGSQIFADSRLQLSQAEMVYQMAFADNPDLRIQSFYSAEVGLARIPTQIIVSGTEPKLAFEAATAATDLGGSLE